MKHARFWMVIILAAVVTLTACGGGGGGGGDQTAAIRINELDNSSTEPLSKLTITGTGFKPAADLTVQFFDDGDYSVDVPVLEKTSTSVAVAVPPYFDSTSGEFGAGTVSIQVRQHSSAGDVLSNTLSGLQIGSLPALTLTPGDVTANVAGFMELSLEDTISRLAEFDNIPGDQVNTETLRAQLEALQQQYGQLKTLVRAAIDNPGSAGTIAMINGVPVVLDPQSLAVADQLMVAMIDEILAQLQTSAPTAQGDMEIPARTGALPARSFAVTCETHPEACGASGQPLLTVRNGLTGEETAVAQYNYALALPGASEVLGKMMNWFAATTATIGAVTVLSGVTMPIAAVAVITGVNVEAMVAKYGLDAARLTADPDDKAAAEDLLDDFTGTLNYMRDSVLSPIMGAMSAKAGIAYDLATGWWPVVEDQIPVFLTQVGDFVDTPAPAGVTGYWSGTLNNPWLRWDCPGGEISFYAELDEDAFAYLSGDYYSVPFSGSRSGNQLTINAGTRYGTRSYTWTWDGADTITGTVAYFCWNIETDALISEGSGTFTATRY